MLNTRTVSFQGSLNKTESPSRSLRWWMENGPFCRPPPTHSWLSSFCLRAEKLGFFSASLRLALHILRAVRVQPTVVFSAHRTWIFPRDLLKLVQGFECGSEAPPA